MEIPTRNASHRPVIRCSRCGSDIGLNDVANHHCSASPSSPDVLLTHPPIPNTTATPLPRTDSANSLNNLGPKRPLLPKIDAAAAFRPPIFPGELTPASSGHSSMVSPVSASSGSRSPLPGFRKGSIPGPRRPPSPELTNLDCAFPPFPTANKPVVSKRRERAATQHSESKRSHSRDKSRAARQPIKPPPLVRAATSDNLARHQLDKATPDRISRPSTASSNRKESVSTNGESSRTGSDHISANRSDASFSAPLSRSASGLDNSTGEASLPSHLGTNTMRNRIDPSLNAFSFGETVAEPSNQISNTELSLNRINTAPSATAEPSYKSKRPPPILSDRQISLSTQTNMPSTPQSSSGGVFSKSLGRLFGRRRSQSAVSRREVVRQALSDEPDDYESQVTERSILVPENENPTLVAEPSPVSLSPLRSPEPASSVQEALRQLSGHEESLRVLEGLAPGPNEATVVIVEPVVESAAPSPVPSASAEVHEQVAQPAITGVPAGGDSLVASVQRASIESTSSYGSVEFSEHSSSSRSSSPHANTLTNASFESTYSNLLKVTEADFPAPLRPRALEAPHQPASVDAARRGRSSFVEDLESSQDDSTGIFTEAPSDQRDVGLTVTQPAPAARSSSKGAPPNKGICRGCSTIIQATQKSVSSADGRLSGRYHKECFVCWTCKAPFATAEFYVHSDHPYCAHHYHELEDSLCATCGQGIEGLYMETHNVAGRGKEKHHPDCLKCTTCRVRLDHDYFELSGKVYCERDAFRLATMPKTHDNLPSRPSPLIREYISSGDPGLIKGRNFPERRITRLMNMT